MRLQGAYRGGPLAFFVGKGEVVDARVSPSGQEVAAMSATSGPAQVHTRL